MIDILMATYNGEKHLEQQLDSILRQSYQDWQLIVRDDCSLDYTWTILEKYRNQYPKKIKIVKAEVPSGSAMQNFFKLIDFAAGDYVMFSDQDDVWLPEKIEVTLAKMEAMEHMYGSVTPLLVHTDMRVVNEQLQTINDSIFAMQCMDYHKNKLNNLVTTNIVTGCTMMVNRSLLSYVEEKPQHAVMHDMWLALVAAAFGNIGFVPLATMLYRQHSTNANGAKDVNSLRYYLWKLRASKEIHQGLVERYQQAGEFRRIFLPQLNIKQAEMLACYSRFESMNVFAKLHILYKYDLEKRGFLKVLGQILI